MEKQTGDAVNLVQKELRGTEKEEAELLRRRIDACTFGYEAPETLTLHVAREDVNLWKFDIYFSAEQLQGVREVTVYVPGGEATRKHRVSLSVCTYLRRFPNLTTLNLLCRSDFILELTGRMNPQDWGEPGRVLRVFAPNAVKLAGIRASFFLRLPGIYLDLPRVSFPVNDATGRRLMFIGALRHPEAVPNLRESQWRQMVCSMAYITLKWMANEKYLPDAQKLMIRVIRETEMAPERYDELAEICIERQFTEAMAVLLERKKALYDLSKLERRRERQEETDFLRPDNARVMSRSWAWKSSEDGGQIITRYRGQEEEVWIPRSIAGKPVRAIQEGVFSERQDLQEAVKAVHIPAGVQLPKAFLMGFEELERVCFEGAPDEPEGEKEEQVFVPDSAFQACTALKEIHTDGCEIISVGEEAFWHCMMLDVRGLLPHLKKAGPYCFEGTDLTGELRLPETLPLSMGMFRDCGVERVVLPETLREIPPYFLALCDALHEITIPSSVRVIGKGAFAETGLTDVIFAGESALERMEEEVFLGCSLLSSISLPSSLETVSSGCFRRCTMLSEVELPESIRHIGDHAFRECIMLRNIRLPEKLGTIGRSAFAESGLKEIVLPEHVVLGDFAFEKCSQLKHVRWPRRLREIPMNAFSHCGLGPVLEIPEGVQAIGGLALYHNDRLEKIILPSTLREVAPYAFGRCSSLRCIDASKVKCDLTAARIAPSVQVIRGKKDGRAVEDEEFWEPC
ncbi:MAG: leucine-rich repeat domain-containing protein [Clostridia bacterium]|nr:leucine-rich repeat domain-containing protein [Clostridia bacterium]